jgi:hypothetical protein
MSARLRPRTGQSLTGWRAEFYDLGGRICGAALVLSLTGVVLFISVGQWPGWSATSAAALLLGPGVTLRALPTAGCGMRVLTPTGWAPCAGLLGHRGGHQS